MNKETGGPAFPGPSDYGTEGNPIYDEKMHLGMTLRDYFAEGALNIVPKQTCYNMKANESDADFIARKAYEIADAMMKARK